MLRLVTAPTADVVTLAQAKLHLRVDHDDDDAVIAGLIAAAVARLDGRDGILGRALASQTWDYCLPEFPTEEQGAIALPLPPTVSVASVKYLDTTGAEQTVSSSDYVVAEGGYGGAIVLPLAYAWSIATAIRPDAVRVRFTAGYASVPKPIVQAVLLMVGDWYEQRGNALVGVSAAVMPIAVDALIAPYRLIYA